MVRVNRVSSRLQNNMLFIDIKSHQQAASLICSSFVEWKTGCIGGTQSVLGVNMVSTCQIISDPSHQSTCEEARSLYFKVVFVSRIYDRANKCISKLQEWQNLPELLPWKGLIVIKIAVILRINVLVLQILQLSCKIGSIRYERVRRH